MVLSELIKEYKEMCLEDVPVEEVLEDLQKDDTQNEWKQIVVKQGEHIKKLAEQNRAQDVIINKLNAEYNLKGKKK